MEIRTLKKHVHVRLALHIYMIFYNVHIPSICFTESRPVSGITADMNLTKNGHDRSSMREIDDKQKGWLAQKVVQESKFPGWTKDQPAVFLSLP